MDPLRWFSANFVCWWIRLAPWTLPFVLALAEMERPLTSEVVRLICRGGDLEADGLEPNPNRLAFARGETKMDPLHEVSAEFLL